MTDSLWRGAGRPGGRPTAAHAYLALQHLGGPAYRWAVAHDVPGVSVLRTTLRRRLMGSD